MPSKASDFLKKILFDMIPVILGILIALLINNWKEEQKNKNFVAHVVTAIQTEAEENIQEIEKFLPKKEKSLDSIYFYLQQKDLTLMDLLNHTDGISTPFIKNTAWRSFLNPNLQAIDFEVVSILTNIDESKKHLEYQGKELSNLVYNNLSSTDYGVKIAMTYIIEEMVEIEEELLKDHLLFMERTGKPQVKKPNN